MAEFIRLAEVVNKKKDMRVVSINVIPTITDCSGTLWITDLQIQEGSVLAGYAPHTEKMLEKLREGDAIKPPVWFNGIVRSNETVILCNMGEASTGLDIDIYPKSNMAAGTIELAQGVGGQRVSFPVAVNKDDDLALYASTRECKKNGVPTKKEGFYQYSAAWDSKHIVKVEKGKTARVLYTMQEMQDGGELF